MMAWGLGVEAEVSSGSSVRLLYVSGEVWPGYFAFLLTRVVSEEKSLMFIRPKKYIVSSGSEPPDLGYVDIRTLADSVCRYDLNDMDAAWLELTNEELKEMGESPWVMSYVHGCWVEQYSRHPVGSGSSSSLVRPAPRSLGSSQKHGFLLGISLCGCDGSAEVAHGERGGLWRDASAGMVSGCLVPALRCLPCLFIPREL